MALNILTIDQFDYQSKTVLLRVDINSPIDLDTKRIVDDSRIDKSIPTIRVLAEKGARVVLVAHQGDTLDYQNLVSLREHAQKLSQKMKRKVLFIDDVAGPAARKRIRSLKDGEVLLLDNLRYLIEEVSTFETHVKLTPEEMLETYLVRNLAPLMDYYVNDAFAAAHRNSPSMVAFQELLPSAGGRLLIDELNALSAIVDSPVRPCVFVLGGLKISDAFGMLRQVLLKGIADLILTAGVTGQVMHMAQGKRLGKISEEFIKDRSLDAFIPDSREYLTKYPEKLYLPLDFGVDIGGVRKEVSVNDLPADGLIVDIGGKTLDAYAKIIIQAGTVFVNGSPGIFEKDIGQKGTRDLWSVIAEAPAFTVLGGGDTVLSFNRFTNINKIGFVSTGGGALIRYLSGQRLPVLDALGKAAKRFGLGKTK